MSSVTFNVSVEESHAILKKVLPLMSQQRVPTIPQNYAVWYDFVCRADARLVAELEERLSRGGDFTPEACQRLYEKYFLDELRHAVDGIQQTMRGTVETLIGEVGSLDDGLDSFVSALREAGEALAGEPGPEQLRGLLAGLAQQTLATRDRSVAMEASLQRMTAQLNELRVQVDALSRDSSTDALTGAATRRAFEDGLMRMTREVNDIGSELCLLLADIDRFAAFNRTHGTAAGDQVLRFVARELGECVKGRDLLARYEGAAFAILLPATSYNGALMLSESIRAIIEAQVVDADTGVSIADLTLSIGVTQYRRDEPAAEFVARGAACLAHAKCQGRNRVTGERDLRPR